MQVWLYTDGACDIHASNRPGGWAAILRAVDDKGAVRREEVLSGGQEHSTNNQMELQAVIGGLQALKRPARLTIVSDSRYVIDIASGKKRAAKNKALWARFWRLAAPHQIQWRYVAGHSGHPLNERCDRLAVAEKNKLARPAAMAAPASETEWQIYLSTQKKGRDSAWAALLVNGSQARELSGRLPSKTELEGTLIGAIAALEGLPSTAAATLYTAQDYLAKGMNDWLPGWQAKGWQTRAGAPVKYKRHWQALQRLATGRRLYFRFVKARDTIPYFRRGKALAKETLECD